MSNLLFDDDELDDVEPHEAPSRRGSRIGRWLTVLMVVGLLVVLGLAAAGWWVQRQIDPPGSPGEEVAITVDRGASTSAIADLLEDKDVITSAQVFRLYLRFKGSESFQAGQYTLRENMAMGDVKATLEDGPAISYTRVTVPPGLTAAEIPDAVAKNPQFSAERFAEVMASGEIRSKYQPDDVVLMEGVLFPETYSVDESEDEADLLQRMVSTFDQTADELGYATAAEQVGIDPYKAIIVASLIEDEGKVPEDLPKIARVIYNRIDEGMLLQIDATVIYALGERRENGQVLYEDLEVDSPYNTYKYPGLPPTPIAAPARAALDAALHPADGPWLYYVKCKTDGTHCFSTTLQEHNAYIQQAKEDGVNP